TLHFDELLWSLLVSVLAALFAHLIAYGALSLQGNSNNPVRRRASRIIALILHVTIFLAMLLPASLIAVAILKILAYLNLPATIRQGWYIVSAGQAARFAGVALIVLLLARSSHNKQLSEAAMMDSATPFRIWFHIHLPRTWPLLAGSFILVMMLSVTELSATMVLLPAGLPNFAQSLLNQMHYVRDQHVIVSSLLLTGTFLVLAVIMVVLLRLSRIRQSSVLASLILAVIILGGCDEQSGSILSTDSPRVLNHFGTTGRGRTEFLYPRAIEITSEGCLCVIDKTGRIQALTFDGGFIDSFDMPKIEAGKPTGLSVGPDGNIYIADTHYHRVAVFSTNGKLINQFGKFGEQEGCFIYPTDVAFAGDGRIYVSEYGGNDRISVFDQNGVFQFCFGAAGSGQDQFGRPSALQVDKSRNLLYIADACNHRIAVYNLDGKLIKYIGSIGTAAGQLRYPYDLDLLDDGTIVICEYGNNRIQLFDPDGRSLAVYGKAGRTLGQLAYPWGVVVDKNRRAFIVDAGNDRIQVWQL
ncbi:MAG: 6-bladed beta-propeller, partial [Planctomycetota bacterium]